MTSFITRISPAPPLDESEDNDRFWQNVEGLDENSVKPSFFVVKVMTAEEGILIKEGIEGEKILYFDGGGNIFVRPGGEEDTDFSSLCTADGLANDKCILINNPLTSEMNGGNITQNFLKNTKSNIMTYKNPTTVIENAYTSGQTFTNKKLIMSPSLKWILYTDANDVVKLLYNPIHSKEYKDITPSNRDAYRNVLTPYCAALNNSPEGQIFTQQYFSDPTCNGYYDEKTCINSVQQFNFYDTQNAQVRNLYGGASCICKSPSYKYGVAINAYDRDDTFLNEMSEIDKNAQSVENKCPSNSINIQNIDCKTILNSANDINMEDSQIVNDCNIKEEPKCDDFTGCVAANRTLIQAADQIPGDSVDVCCQTLKCDKFTGCGEDKMLKENSDRIQGDSVNACCKVKPAGTPPAPPPPAPLMCAVFNGCPVGTTLRKNADQIQGADEKTCCKAPVGLCSAFKGCNAAKKDLILSDAVGDTVSECCATRTCPEGCGQGKCVDGTCECDAGFSGSSCQNSVNSNKIKHFVLSNMPLIIGASSGVVILIIVLIILLTR